MQVNHYIVIPQGPANHSKKVVPRKHCQMEEEGTLNFAREQNSNQQAGVTRRQILA